MAQIRLECGRKLEYQVNGASGKDEEGFVTLIRYDPIEAPFGRAAALFDWRTGAMEVCSTSLYIKFDCCRLNFPAVMAKRQ
jgi:hypothetical protein